MSEENYTDTCFAALQQDPNFISVTTEINEQFFADPETADVRRLAQEELSDLLNPASNQALLKAIKTLRNAGAVVSPDAQNGFVMTQYPDTLTQETTYAALVFGTITAERRLAVERVQNEPVAFFFSQNPELRDSLIETREVAMQAVSACVEAGLVQR